MGFRLIAEDRNAGIRIRSGGSPGAEIEYHVWHVEGPGFAFDLDTSVTSETVNNCRKVRLAPSIALIDYLLHGPGRPEDRKAIVDGIEDGLRLLFPTSFRLPFFFERGVAVSVKIVQGKPKAEAVEAPGLWDAVRAPKA